jgi:hypothetical protein
MNANEAIFGTIAQVGVAIVIATIGCNGSDTRSAGTVDAAIDAGVDPALDSGSGASTDGIDGRPTADALERTDVQDSITVDAVNPNCGALNQPCCPATYRDAGEVYMCNGSDLGCQYGGPPSGNNRCLFCGDPGQPCCNGFQCKGGSSCVRQGPPPYVRGPACVLTSPDAQ